MGGGRSNRLALHVRHGLAGAIGLALFLVLAGGIVPTYIHRPWDFATYWYAGMAASQGLNPYDTAALTRLAQWPVGMPFLYPPITLPVVMPLTLLPFERAAQVWLATNLLLLLALVLLWRRYFLPDANIILVAGVAVFGFNAACLWDVLAGNVGIIEELLLWAGFAAFTLEHRRVFALCVICAALFKIFPIAFLGLLLVPSRKRGPEWKVAGGAMALFACLVLVPALVGPAWARGFLHNVPAERPWGLANPSALGFIDTLLGDHRTPLTSPPFKALILLLAYDSAIVGLSIPTLRRLWRRRSPREWALASAVLYALLVPRMMAYSYLLVIVPVLVLLTPIVSRFGGRTVGVGLVASQALLGPILRSSYTGVWGANLSFLTLLGFWLVYLTRGGRHSDVYAEQTGQAVSRHSALRSSRNKEKQRRAPARRGR